MRLDSNCEDLDLFAIGWDETTCPDAKHSNRIAECEMTTKPGGGSLVLTTVNRPQVFLVGVDGKQGASGNFRLSLGCSLYR